MGLLITVVGPRGNTFSTASFISLNNVHFLILKKQRDLALQTLSDQFVGFFLDLS